MAHIELTVADVAGIRRLLTIDIDDFSQGVRSCLLALTRLIPCEIAGFGIGDGDGFVEFAVTLPDDMQASLGTRSGAGPWASGVEQLAGRPATDPQRLWMQSAGFRDILRVGFALGGGRVAQVSFARRTSVFEPRHVELLSMLEPALVRLLRPRDGGDSLARLSQAERRVLHLVALGGSNRDIAQQLSLSEATVRKHLENTYRKLDVTNRTAAAALVHMSGALLASADPLMHP